MSTSQKVTNVLVYVAVSAAIALLVSGMTTRQWMKADSEVHGNFTYKRLFFGVDINIDVHSGLKSCCMEMNIDLDLSRINPKIHGMVKRFLAKVPTRMAECVYATDTTTSSQIDADLWHALRHFKHIFVCMTIGLVALCSSLIALMVKSYSHFRSKFEPRKTNNNSLISIVLMMISAMPIAVAVVIAHRELHGQARFVDLGINHYEAKFISTLPFAPKPTKPPTTPLLTTVKPTTPFIETTNAPTNDNVEEDNLRSRRDSDNEELIKTPDTSNSSATLRPVTKSQRKSRRKSSSRRRKPRRRRRKGKKHDPMKDVHRILDHGREVLKSDIVKDWSYWLVIAGLSSLVFAILVALVEMYCEQSAYSSAGSDTSSNRLVVDGVFDMPEKAPLTDV